MQNNPTDFDNDQMPVSTPPEMALGMFNAELKHYINSIEGCAQILAMKHSNEETRQHYLDIIFGNLDRMKSLRESVKIYLDKRIE